MNGRNLFLALLVLSLWHPAAAAGALARKPEPIIKSSRVLAVEPFQSRLATAQGEKQSWVSDPNMIILMLEGPEANAPFVQLTRVDDRSEDPRNSTVTILVDGIPDDQLAAMWTEFRLAHDGERWRIVGVRRALRCRRSANPNSFQSELCP